MSVSQLDREDYAFFKRCAEIGRAQRLVHFVHLDQPIGILSYIRIANDIAARVPRGRLLDWGCGYGQMTYLLRRRGFDVVAFDIGPDNAGLPDIPLTDSLTVVRTTHPTRLPFEDAAFDAVLSCGVLEHVDEFSSPGNEILSLAEIRRVLKPGGHLLVYQLPQRHSWPEAAQRILIGGYTHPRRFTAREIRAMLERAGYRVQSLRRSGMLPKNLTGLPQPVRDLYGRFSEGVLALDAALSRVPLLNTIAGVLEVIARRYD